MPAHCDLKYRDVKISDLTSWYNIQYHMIKPDLIIQYSISDYQTWPHGSIFDIRISDLTSRYDIWYQIIRPDLMIRYSISDYQTWLPLRTSHESPQKTFLLSLTTFQMTNWQMLRWRQWWWRTIIVQVTIWVDDLDMSSRCIAGINLNGKL